VTEFIETAMRHFCRNPKCRSKLPTPVSNSREAFCARGCHTSFFRKRCLVCEQPMERKTEHQLVCGKRACRNALQGGQSFGRYHASSSGVSPSKKPANTGEKSGVAHGRPWHIVARTVLNPDQLRAAAVPDGPNCQWKIGEFERTEAKNRQLLERHFAQLDATVADNCAICGTGEDLVDHKPVPNSPERTVTLCRGCRDEGRDYVAKPRPDLVVPDELSIPSFLDRRPA
jgi:hypothetical protein